MFPPEGEGDEELPPLPADTAIFATTKKTAGPVKRSGKSEAKIRTREKKLFKKSIVECTCASVAKSLARNRWGERNGWARKAFGNCKQEKKQAKQKSQKMEVPKKHSEKI